MTDIIAATAHRAGTASPAVLNADSKRRSRRLAGRTAVITGGTTGIGLETARHFIAEGARVLITGRDEGRVTAALATLGKGAHGFVGDVQSLAMLDALADRARTVFGSVDILIANAGLGIFGAIADIDEIAYDRQFDVNVKGVFFTVQKLLPLMAAGASIVLTASAVNAKGAPTGSVYFASKAAVRSFARSLAAELGPRGIRVNSLSPGIVRTHFAGNSNLPDQGLEGFIASVTSQAPLGREATTAEIAAAAVFLASDDSRYMTAADLVVDGGWMNV